MLTRYRQNLHVEGNKVYSYDTNVATIQGNKLVIHGYWSQTTSKHINYVAKEYGLTKIEGEKEPETKQSNASNMKTLGMIASLGDIFGTTKTEKNDWKERMLKAGLENKGLIMPEDWNELSENEKEKRLNGVIKIATE